MTNEIIQIATNMSNWKNVNNWHWVEKNCMEWARKWLADSLKAVEPRDIASYSNVRVTSVHDIAGDADLNVRKGKLRYLYDLSLKMVVSGEYEGENCECKVNISEYTFDEEPENFQYSFSSKDDVFRAFVEKIYIKDLYEIFQQFPKQLVEQNAGSLLVEPDTDKNGKSAAGGDSAKLIASDNPVEDAGKIAVAAEKEKKQEKGTVSVDLQADFKCSPEDIFTALTSADRISMWSHAPCSFKLKENEPFTLFGGAITGRVVSFEENKNLTLKWRLRSWPSTALSEVVFTIQNRDDYIRLVVEQTGIPKNEQDGIEESWKQMYFERIKHTFGYVY